MGNTRCHSIFKTIPQTKKKMTAIRVSRSPSYITNQMKKLQIKKQKIAFAEIPNNKKKKGKQKQLQIEVQSKTTKNFPKKNIFILKRVFHFCFEKAFQATLEVACTEFI